MQERGCNLFGGAAVDAVHAVLQTPGRRNSSLPLNYYLLALPLALLASPLASSVPFIAFLNNFYK